jgi:hypothetical protein
MDCGKTRKLEETFWSISLNLKASKSTQIGTSTERVMLLLKVVEEYLNMAIYGNSLCSVSIFTMSNSKLLATEFPEHVWEFFRFLPDESDTVLEKSKREIEAYAARNNITDPEQWYDITLPKIKQEDLGVYYIIHQVYSGIHLH